MAKILALSKSLLVYWIVNLVVIGIGTVLVVFVLAPPALMVITRTISIELLPNWDDIYKSTKFVIFAAFWTGTILWAKEEFFTKK